ncbi:MAG: RNB domain-containing ribonuclease, partial [Betaproteobacteria bacterium]|nr:RNB domain-containing ribonuclease [Betaproteobacteria bacterium]
HLRMALAGMPKVADGDVSCEVDASALPLLAKDAFSIDGAGTLEIDDAFSVTQGKAGTWQLGIHIAAPALGLPAAAQERAEQLMTSVYLPDRKIMQFPESVVHAYALRAGCECPAISLLQDFDPETGRIGPPQLQIGKVQVAANLSLDSFLDWQPGDPGEFSRQLAVLSMFCKQLPSGRNTRALERSFIVRSSSESGLRIIPRQRLAEIDAVVAALMVHYNQAGTERLRAAQAARLLRSAGRNLVRDRGDDRHQEYAWLSSPLRRYIDLLNQQQLIAVLDGRNLPHDADFMRKQALDYDEHAAAARRAQQILERYWAFHWLQPRIGEVFTGVIGKCRRSVHLDDLPVAVKLDKPAVLAEATPVKVRVESVDLGELVGRGKLCA